MSWFDLSRDRKSLKCSEFLRGAKLAFPLGVIVCAQACLVPQNVEPVAPGTPHPAPHFVLESVPSYLVAPVLQLVRQGSLDAAANPPCHCQLQIPPLPIEEDDPTVDLEARWFIDYDQALPRTQVVFRRDTGGKLQGTFDNATLLQRAVPEFDFDADLLVNPSGLHKLEVLVGETAAFDDSSTAALPNRTPKVGYALALMQFTINVDVQQDRASCPSSPPSVRICQ